MTLSRILYSNLKGLRHKYVTFLLSSSFSIMIFYLFASLMFHPDFRSGHISSRANVLSALMVCEVIIVAFSFFFMWYSSSSFLKSRKREFGLFSLLGATQKQLNQIIGKENAVIGAASIGIGLLAGTLLFKLLLLAVGKIMMVEVPIRFELVPIAILLTCVVYAGLFFLINLFTRTVIRLSLVIQLVRAPEKPHPLPRYSLFLVALSLLCLGGGYYLAWTVDGNNLAQRMLPVVGIVSIGTYFFFTQTNVAVLQRLRQNLGFSYRGTNLLTLGDLVFKMKENAQVLAVVSIFSALVMTSVGTLYTGNALLLGEQESRYERAMAFGVMGEKDTHRMSQVARKALESRGFIEYQEIALWGLRARFCDLTYKDLPDPEERRYSQTLLVSEEEFNTWVNSGSCKESYLKPVGDVKPGEAVRLVPPGSLLTLPQERIAYFALGEVPLRKTGESQTPYAVRLKYSRQHFLPPFRAGQNDVYPAYWSPGVNEIFVVDDNQIDRWLSLLPSDEKTDRNTKLAYFIYDFQRWKGVASKEAADEIGAKAGPGLMDLSAKINGYMDRRQNVSLTLFIAVFVPALFFIASGSVLYFRLFTELWEDQAKYAAMRKLGLSWKELSTVITRQIRLIFLAPFLVGAVHCLFAFKALANVLNPTPWSYAGTSIGLFFLMQTTYYLLTRKAYLTEIARMQ